MLVEAWPALIARYPDLYLVIVGSGKLSFDDCEEAIRAFVTERQLTASVKFAGESDRVHEYLQAADLFIFPTEYEGFSLALVEALACAMPVVVTAVGAAPDLIRQGENGFLFAPKDPTAMLEALHAALSRSGSAGRRSGQAARDSGGAPTTWDASPIAIVSYAALRRPCPKSPRGLGCRRGRKSACAPGWPARSWAGSRCAWSGSGCVLQSGPLRAPEALRVDCASAAVVGLSWSPAAEGAKAAAYRILRDGALLGTTGEPRFADTTVSAAATYRYVIQAADGAGHTAASPAATVSTAAASPGGDAPYCSSPVIRSMTWDWAHGDRAAGRQRPVGL